jgi:hypothetical protein
LRRVHSKIPYPIRLSSTAVRVNEVSVIDSRLGQHSLSNPLRNSTSRQPEIRWTDVCSPHFLVVNDEHPASRVATGSLLGLRPAYRWVVRYTVEQPASADLTKCTLRRFLPHSVRLGRTSDAPSPPRRLGSRRTLRPGLVKGHFPLNPVRDLSFPCPRTPSTNRNPLRGLPRFRNLAVPARLSMPFAAAPKVGG